MKSDILPHLSVFEVALGYSKVNKSNAKQSKESNPEKEGEDRLANLQTNF